MATINTASRDNISLLLNRQQSSHRTAKSSPSNFTSRIDSLDTQDTVAEFITLPSQTSNAYKIFDKMASEGLPESFPATGLNEQAEAVRNMLGIIYKHAQPEDEKKFQKVFGIFKKVHTDFINDKGTLPELGDLFCKYGEVALRQHVSDYTQHCRKAWEYHHTVDIKSIKDEHIFSPSVMACYDVLEHNIKELSQNNQTWETIACSGNYFKGSCAAISKTLRYHDATQVKQPLMEPSLQNESEAAPSRRLSPAQENPQASSISTPASNGPITINNTVHGGNGTSTINDSAAQRAATSDIDFGIALLNAPELGHEKARLVEKFMDLHWGRSKNGGQDRFADHLKTVVFSQEPILVKRETLPPPSTMQAIESFVSMPVPQFAVELTASSKQENTHSSSLIVNDGAKNLPNAVKQVAQALSGLLREVDTSQQAVIGGKNEPLAKELPLSATILPSPLAMQAIESFISMPAPQFAVELATGSKQEKLENTHSSPLIVNDRAKIIPNDFEQLRQALSGLLHKTDSSQQQVATGGKNELLAGSRPLSTNILSSLPVMQATEPFASIPVPQFYVELAASNKQEKLENTHSSPLIVNDDAKNTHNTIKQAIQALSNRHNDAGFSQQTVAMTDSETAENPVSSHSQVQRLVKKFEKINAEQRIRNESTANRRYLDSMSYISNDQQPTRRSATGELNFQPMRTLEHQIKEITHQKPIYTTNRTVDLFNRSAIELKSLVNSYNNLEDEREEISLDSETLENK